MAGSETSTGLEGPLRLCDFIRKHRARLLETWAEEACLLPGARGLSRPRLLEHLPDLLDRIAQAVEMVHTGEPSHLEVFPEVHALDRLDAGFDLEQVASEYALLRGCILRLYSEHMGERNVGVLVQEVLRFNQTFDMAVSTAVARYARARERTLVAREREALARVRAQEERAVRLQSVTAALSQALTTTDVARVVLDKAVRALGARGGSIGLLTADGQWFETLEAHGHRDEELRHWTRFPADSPVMFRQAVLTREPVLYEAVEHFLDDYPQWRELALKEGYGAFATLPLVAEGQVLGAMGLTFHEARTFCAEEVAFMLVLAGQCAQALERSRLYDAAQRARAEAHLHLTRLDLLMDTAPVGLAFLDTELRYVRINERLAEMNGRSVAHHLGRTVREVLPEIGSTLDALLHGVLETGRPVVDLEISGETPAAPGVLRHWLVSYYRVQDVNGPPLGLGGVVVEITERKRAEEELRQTAEFRERFLGIVSHDLRTPLNAILLSASALLHSEAVEKRYLKAVRRITTSAERMGRMISALLDFTRGRLGGGIPIHPQPANLRHICRNVVEELEAGYPERKLRLSTEGRFQGEWDPDRLAQAFGNLGKNALEYSPGGTPVDFVLRDEGDTVRLEVHNEGPPIPAETLSFMFEPFQRAVEHPVSSGLGLGLFIVQQIITAHGGTVEVRSRETEGTTFTVRLPRRACASGPPPPGRPSPR